MQQRPPQYVVNCLISSGFDTLPLIADMDMKSLDDVEQFCGSYQEQLMQYPNSAMASSSLKFPPGHHKAILKLIEEVHVSNVQNEKKRLDRKKPSETDVPKRKKRCHAQRSSTCSDGKESSLAATYSEI